jgi:hypothetical protein
MAWLFAQMWMLELAAFLLGAAATWVAFVRPARAAARAAAQAPPPGWVPEPAPTEPEPAPPTRPPDPAPASPALAELDAHARHARRSGLLASGALDEMTTTSPLPVIPAQAGPSEPR